MMISRRTIQTICALAILSTWSAACSVISPTPTATPDPEPVDFFDPIVSATGVVLPQRTATLSMAQPGLLEEVLVAEGEMVEEDQLLARLKSAQSRERLEAAVVAAEFELNSARLALEDLYENVPMQLANAQLALANARDALKDAEYKWNVQQEGNRASGTTISGAKANLTLAEEEVDRAESVYNRFSGRPESDPARALALSNLVAARQQRDAVLRQLNWFLGEPTDIDQAILDAEVLMAQVQVNEALDEAEMLQAGPDPDLVSMAEDRIRNATAQLDAANAALEDLEPDLELRAPFRGTVTELYLNQDEWAAPGVPVLLLADLGALRVETTDLGEVDVARVAVGAPATVSFDALVDVVVTGRVVRISDKATAGSGVNYKVIVLLDDIPPGLRWGMTAFVDIEIEG